MTEPTETEIRARIAEHGEWERKNAGHWHTLVFDCADGRELLRLLDEARAERDELLAHEKQTHESLGAILGTDDSLETCAKRMRAERDEATAEGRRLRNVLMREGFVPCDIPACNCGSFHHRYGLPERMAEIREELTNADVLNDETGNLPIRAVQRLVAERDGARDLDAQYQRQIAALEAAVRNAMKDPSRE